MQKDFKIAVLLDCYGELLTTKQRTVIDLYYNHDLSLAEIAENLCVTRQAVRDAIMHAQIQLVETEEKLGFVKRLEQIDSALHLIRSAAEQLPDSQQKKCILALANLNKEE
ncbi:MAG: sigma factor-like helix-turn-helix DNA-binding protein [Acutalibacteraceae bacterium]|nr:sigma factor-like helix-turn-helix DNA-binding protein [Acutalibacteraceae bacterium]